MKIVLSPSKTKTLSGTASKGFFQQKNIRCPRGPYGSITHPCVDESIETR